MCLHIVRNPVSNDSRVLKETGSLIKNGLFNTIEIAGFHEEGNSKQEWLGKRKVRRFKLTTRSFPKSLPFQVMKYIEWFLRLLFAYANKKIVIIHCHDLEPLPIAVVLKCLTGARLVYDAHEFETETYGKNGIRKKLSQFTEGALVKHVDEMITVSPSIQDWYEKKYKISVSLLRNIPDLTEYQGNVIDLKGKLGIPNDSVLFLYLGHLSLGRGIENILNSFSRSAVKHHVLFLGTGHLFGKVIEASREHANIHHLAPVTPDKVVSYAKGADVGLCLYEDTCLNYRYCLPNKLFESILSGIPVLSSDLPDQSSIVSQYQAGWVVQNTVESISEFLRDIKPSDVRSISVGLEQRVSEFTWDNESQVLLEIYERVGRQQ